MIEHRVCWNASSNISFRGETEWEPWDDEDETDPEKVQDEMSKTHGHMNLPLGFEMALEASGFDWWIETREA